MARESAMSLADAVISVCIEANRRIKVEGAKSYSTEKGETFEQETTADVLQELEEELFDTINYAALATLKLRVLRKKIDAQLAEHS